jgi:hypothetical protein
LPGQKLDRVQSLCLRQAMHLAATLEAKIGRPIRISHEGIDQADPAVWPYDTNISNATPALEAAGFVKFAGCADDNSLVGGLRMLRS